MNISTMQADFARLTLAYGLMELIAFVAAAWVLYHVIKAGIRDGLRESGILQSLAIRHTRPDPETRLGDTRPSPLPDMRAER